MKLLSFAPLAVVLATLPACGPQIRVSAPSYDTGELTIHVQKIEVDDGKLELKFTFINRTQRVMFVDRNQMLVRLPDGSTRSRHTGTWSGLGNPVHTIWPGVSHNVFMDFMIGDIVNGQVALVLSGVIVDGRPLPLPDYVMELKQVTETEASAK